MQDAEGSRQRTAIPPTAYRLLPLNMIDDSVDRGSPEEAVSSGEHVPVLYEEVLAGLNPRPRSSYVDATVGRGGHAAGILQRSAPDGRLLALDADPTAVSVVQARLAPFGERATVVQANFRSLGTIVRAHGWEHVDGVLIDLGLSSAQLGAPDRGFSFASEGPLDMRFDPTATTTAADLVNTLGETDLARLFFDFGEEPHARRIARAIVEERRRNRIDSTTHLARLVERAAGRRGRIHPATRVFQALRIAVNGELDALAAALPQAGDLLRPGGRLAGIAVHSLEDRLTKRFLRQEMMTCVCPPAQPVCTCAHHPTLRALTKGAVKATADEVRANRRARSARLRVAERLKEPEAPC